VHKDIALGLACLATFALAVVYVSQTSRTRTERDARRITRLETQLRSLERRVASIAREPTLELGSSQAAETAQHTAAARPTTAAATSHAPANGSSTPGLAPAQPLELERALEGIAAGNGRTTRIGSAQRLLSTSQEELTLHAARTLLEVDLEQGLSAVSQIVTTARGARAAHTAMAALSLLAEHDGPTHADPAIDQALHEYAEADSQLVRLHAAKLLERRGDEAPVALAIEELSDELSRPERSRRLQALALLGLARKPATIPKILPLLQDESSEIRSGALLALARFDDSSFHSQVTPLLQDPVPRVQALAAQVMRRTGAAP
jgi:hypothetical protein